MIVEELALSGLKLIRPRVFADERGLLFESYQAPRYRAHGIHDEFVQDNHVCSRRDTLRGLHYQSHPGQAKLIRVTRGRIFDVAVDIRPGSPTFGRWASAMLDAERHEQLYIPVGFAHGFCVVSDVADVVYKLGAVYDPSAECGIAHDDPELAIDWPVSTPRLSPRDRANESFAVFRARVGR